MRRTIVASQKKAASPKKVAQGKSSSGTGRLANSPAARSAVVDVAFDQHDDFDDNEDQLSDLNPTTFERFRVYSRDWTVGTIIDQVMQDNIDLQPTFQRRNAWTDAKRIALIESLILGIPVPQLVFAEDSSRPGGFIVIDGKQRLLSIAGFMHPDAFKYWDKPVLRNLAVLGKLNDASFDDLKNNAQNANYLRRLTNSDIRCSVISAGSSDDMLYYVFYRLNSGSVTLSTQELRQALNPGAFTTYLAETSATSRPLHQAMSLAAADPRFRDTEVLLRYFAFSIWPEDYSGNLREFLDDTLQKINRDWENLATRVGNEYKLLSESISKVESVLGPQNVGKRYEASRFQGRFNRALFEVEVLYFKHLSKSLIVSKKAQLRTAIQRLCTHDAAFLASITSTTKSKEQYKIRFAHFRRALAGIIPPKQLPTFPF